MPPSRSTSENDTPADDTLTPRASTVLEAVIPQSGPSPAPPPSLSPQTTGEWFRAQLRRGSQLLGLAGGSLFGGLSLNRLSPFVTSGADDFIFNGSGSEDAKERQQESIKESFEGLPSQHDWRFSTYLGHSRHPTEEAQHDHNRSPNSFLVDVGPTWRAKVPSFSVRVHSPERRQPAHGERSNEPFVVYCITSTFSGQATDTTEGASGTQIHMQCQPFSCFSLLAAHSMSVYRRFSHFVRLHNALAALLPGIALPPLPEKAYAGRFNADFVEARRGELDRYIRKIVAHPVLRYTDALTFFLGCEDELVS